MVSFEMNDRKKVGLGLAGFGVFFSFLGIIFFFDKGLLAIGNILFLSGVILSIGLTPSLQFFMKPSNFKGTVSYGVGFFLVIIGWPIIGMIVETYGFFLLFSGFWPTVAVFLQKIPVLGWLFQQPVIRSEYLGRHVENALSADNFHFLITIVGNVYQCKFSIGALDELLQDARSHLEGQ